MTKSTNRKPSSKRAEASAAKAPTVANADRTTAQPLPKDSAGKKKARLEDLRLKVTPGLKQRFKQAAKAAGLKKGALLERLLIELEKRQPGLNATSAPAPDGVAADLRAPAVAPAPQAKRSSRGA